MDGERAFYGTVIHSVSRDRPLVVLQDTLLLVRNGKVAALREGLTEAQAQAATRAKLRKLKKTQFLMPGFVDTHIHASQYTTAGTGYSLTLLDWLNQYTFPAEASFKDVNFAKEVYTKVVRRTLRNGTTTASYFATIHVEASLVLADVMLKYGQRGFVGKVCMDKEAPPYYIEETGQSIADTKKFVELMKAKSEGGLVQACITPRFAVSCTNKLLSGLGEISSEYNLPIQTHMSENKDEIQYVLESNGVKRYAEVYENAGLLTDRTILAHCVYSDRIELGMLEKYGCGVAHCPNSNINIRSGLMDIREVEKHNVTIGLATDLSGGYSSSMQDSIRKSIETSKTLRLNKGDNYQNIDHSDAFYLATLGGAKVMNLDSTTGNFDEGKEFDALLVDVDSDNSPIDLFGESTAIELLQKFIYCGDDRNIKQVFVQGRQIQLDDQN